MTEFAHRLAAAAEDFETVLEGVLHVATDPAIPARLLAAMRYAALGGGKRLRPFLTVEATRLTGGDLDAGWRAGAAIELLHVYSLVHDDLPAMDNDAVRRGKPTVHRAYDEATAILVGDALQTLAFETLADPATHADPAIRASLVLALARAAGAAGMAGGQMRDLEAEGRFGDGAPLALAPAAIRELQAMKTGAILACAVDMGAIIGEADLASRSALAGYGRALGAAFQIADDILDIESSTETMGKATGKDAGRGKGTLAASLGLEAAKAERDARAAAAVEALAAFGEEADVLREAALFAARRTR